MTSPFGTGDVAPRQAEFFLLGMIAANPEIGRGLDPEQFDHPVTRALAADILSRSKDRPNWLEWCRRLGCPVQDSARDTVREYVLKRAAVRAGKAEVGKLLTGNLRSLIGEPMLGELMEALRSLEQAGAK